VIAEACSMTRHLRDAIENRIIARCSPPRCGATGCNPNDPTFLVSERRFPPPPETSSNGTRPAYFRDMPLGGTCPRVAKPVDRRRASRLAAIRVEIAVMRRRGSCQSAEPDFKSVRLKTNARSSRVSPRRTLLRPTNKEIRLQKGPA
jgi:hypothetical protein